MTSPSPGLGGRARKSKILLFLALLAISLVASLNIGYQPIAFPEILSIIIQRVPGLGSFVADSHPDPVSAVIIMEIRLPRIAAGAAVGAALAVAGAALQGLFRNPLAEPYVTGVSAGAAVGGALAIVAGLGRTLLGTATVSLLAFAGAVLAVLLTYLVARIGGRAPTANLLLAGISVSVLLSAVVTLLIVLAGEELRGLIFWLMGSLAFVEWRELVTVLPLIAIGISVIYAYSRELNALTQGEEMAQSLGVQVEQTRRILLLSASLITAASVAASGIIGFVGLVIPHVTRLLLGADHRFLIPAAMFSGATFLVLSDAVARLAFRPVGGIGMELPVGVVTALVGAPLFIYLLRRRRYAYRV